MNTVMITGCSSGFGYETAKHFLNQGWNVVATMRTPEDGVLPASDRLRLLPLDVTNRDSIADAVEAAGEIDALINNAGIGLLGAFEGTSMDTAREVFETNSLGMMAVAQAVLPQFRQKNAGIIVNITSSTTLMPLPLVSVYTASKAAVNAFSESLALELQQFNIRVRIVIPGQSPETRFRENAQFRMQGAFPDAYADLAQKLFQEEAKQPSAITRPLDVAEVVWRAVNDASSPVRMAAGADALALAEP